ncbi:MAG: NAD-dependent epimerase/dehydratase family protein, partial [Synechococcaceae bacterium WB9_4xB_025]|nr:NAD-dependent epimerase/dehydratase family protein [Synechococcaceae bacterium WB9_4xB_025]
MRLLLLGCTGLVGRELIPMLLQQGHELTVVSRRPEAVRMELGAAEVTWVG